jgi:DNA-directed RNA polymerase subunit L
MAMRLKLLELTDDTARILFEGEGNTYMNALTDELLRDPAVDVAQCKRTFQFSDPELVVTTKDSQSPLLAILDAAKRLSAYSHELLQQIKALESE